MFMVLFVLNNPDQLEPLLDAWESAGAGGVTIFHSSGLGRLRRKSLRDDLPLIPSLADFMEHDEDLHRTMFSVVDNTETVERLLAATRQVVGDLDITGNGLLVVLPVTQVYGMNKNTDPKE